MLGVAIPSTPAMAQPELSLSPSSGSIGTKVEVTAVNFESFKNTDVNIFFNGKEIADSPKTVPETGSFTAEFYVPDDATPGIAQIMVSTVIGGQVTANFTILGAKITLSPKEGTVGTVVTLNGSGFYAGKTVTLQYYDSYDGTKIELATVDASSIGEISYNFTAPESTTGNHRIVARNDWGNLAELNFKIFPSVTIEPESGAIGDEVTVDGTGFSNQSSVSIYFDGNKVASTKTSTAGTLEVTFEIPVMEAGTYDVEVTDKSDVQDKAEFTVAAGASINPTTGDVGTTITASGVGFKAGETVFIKYDEMEIAKTQANNSGGFSLAFKAPASIGGNHTITITDNDNTINQLFTMESTSPSTPTLISPKATDKVEPAAYFSWEKVDDPSGVTYILQIASDANFTLMVLAKEDITLTDYTLTGVEELNPTEKEAPYYWRVKAIDGASNESEWSNPRSLYIVIPTILPTWAKVLLIVIGVIAAAFVAFWLGRRTAYRS